MGERPILFSAPMVRALLSGAKTQTRRVLKPQPELYAEGRWHVFGPGGGVAGVRTDDVPYEAVYFHRIQPGDRLWVRETWSHSGDGVWSVANAQIALNGSPIYRADGKHDVGCKFFPSIHMPRRFSRLTLIVTDVRVQRIDDITPEDAVAEGALSFAKEIGFGGLEPVPAFRLLWKLINGDEALESNPWVAAYTFDVLHQNIGPTTHPGAGRSAPAAE